MQEHLRKHFERERHSGFRDDVSVILIDKTDKLQPYQKGKVLNANPENYSILQFKC